jgi:hypothetical protein
MAHSNHGITRPKGEEQPTDKERARTAHKTDSDQAVSREATRDPKLDGSDRTPGAGTKSGESRDPAKR